MFPAAHGIVSQRGAALPPVPVAPGGPAIYLFNDGDTNMTTNNVGWSFTVGATPITATELGLYSPSGEQQETVYLYREDDGALLASALVTANGGWGYQAITPVALEANETYLISRWAAGASRGVPRNGGPAVDAAITYASSHVGTTAAMPVGSTSHAWQAVSFRAAAPDAGYRFFRLDQLVNNGAPWLGFHTFGLLEVALGPDVAPASGGVSAGSGLSNLAAAFDANAATGTLSMAPTGAEFLIWDFGSGNEREIVAYLIGSYYTANSVDSRSLSSWRVSGSNDFVSWDTLDEVSGETGWTYPQTREFSL